jgi:hypothetical protein
MDNVMMKSKHRVRKYGEVFTPQWVIDKMIAIPGIKEKAKDIFATFLEPSAGEGAFLLAIEDMKLKFVTDNYGQDTWGIYALWALSSIYGIEFLEDNLAIARRNMLELFSHHYEAAYSARLSKQANLYKAAQTIIWANVVQGDTLTRKNLPGKEIIFSHWDRVSDAPYKVRRRPFTYSSLFTSGKSENSGIQLSLFEPAGQGDLFMVINEDEKDDLKSRAYAVVDIELVWKEEKEDV